MPYDYQLAQLLLFYQCSYLFGRWLAQWQLSVKITCREANLVVLDDQATLFVIPAT